MSGSGTAKADRRSRRTERQLWQALLALLQERDWADITVQLICDRADVARSTFYTHYRTKQDLLDAGFALGTADAIRDMQDRPADGGRVATVQWLINHLAGSKTFLRRLRSSPAGVAINARFKETVRTLLADELARLGYTSDDSQVTFLAGGVFAVAERWMDTGGHETPEAMADRLQTLMLDVLASRAASDGDRVE